MTWQAQQPEYLYLVRIETPTGQSATVTTAGLTSKQVEDFLQFEFKKLAEEAGVKGSRIYVERAVVSDYDSVIREIAACLRSADSAGAARPNSLPHTQRLVSSAY